MAQAAFKLEEFEGPEAYATPCAMVCIDVDLVDEFDVCGGVATTLSEDGVFVSTRMPAPVGTILVVRLWFSIDESLTVLTVVRGTSARAANDNAPHGLSLEFFDLDEEALEQVRSYMFAPPRAPDL